MEAKGPGKTAPRLIADLLDYDPRRNTKNLLIGEAPQFKGDKLPSRTGSKDCHHELKRKEGAVYPTSDDQQPDASTKYVVKTYCIRCRLHYKITVDFQQAKDGQVPCRLSDPENPLHHLRLKPSTDANHHNSNNGKHNQIMQAHHLTCSGARCPVRVGIEISPSRLPDELLSLIIDTSILHRRGVKCIQEEPTRFQNLAPFQPVQVLNNLRHYLVDAKTAAENNEAPKKIQARNKLFALAFASDCDRLLEHLDFVPVLEENPDEVGGALVASWRLPTVTPENKEFIDDILEEIACLMKDRPIQEQNPKLQVSYNPICALKDIERSLGYHGYPTRSRQVDLVLEEHPYYASLGARDNFTDDLLGWAWERQRLCDPKNKPFYLDCLKDLAKGRHSGDLDVRVAMAVSAGELGLAEIEQAYKSLRIDPRTKEGDDHIIGVYYSYIQSASRQKDEARTWLDVIGKARGSEKIQAVANDHTMSFEEATEFLGVSADTPSDSIEAAAIAMSLDTDKARVAKALRVIANKRGDDYTLQRAATTLESGSGEPTLDVGEAYNRLQIRERHAPDETVLSYYLGLTNGAPSGSKDSYTEALRVIALDRQSTFLLRKLDNPDADVQAAPGTADQPVGLDNIGNTCYLNSLLQYYYTVRAVRDVVIDFQHQRMPLTEEDIRRKRVGGRAVAKPEIIKAQKFVDELNSLFHDLKTASTRSIKPTRELAELTMFSSQAEANFRKNSISSPGPPNFAAFVNPVYEPEGPLSIPIQPAPAPVEDDIEMMDNPGYKSVEVPDDSSEATLVDLDPNNEPQLEPLPPYDETKAISGALPNENADSTSANQSLSNSQDVMETDQPEEDAVMVNGGNLTPKSESLPPLESPPPVPPRNKSGLSIQTNEKDKTMDDELWKFGSQQDVTEVIGNVMFRLQCAIKPTSIDDTSGEQIDSVRDTFFGANAVYHQKEKKVEPWANLIVFPDPERSRDIYEALDVVFDEQEVEIDKKLTPQYTSIAKLPPILQIQIQRTGYDPVKQTAWKNRNAVVFPETIYLDRYMDSEPDSTLMRRRRDTWKWKARLSQLEARHKALAKPAAEGEASVLDALVATKEHIELLQATRDKDLDIDPTIPERLEARSNEISKELEDIDQEIKKLKQKLNEHFTSMRECEYKLQSVFIHRGEAGGGHYWIYVYDFENDLWREYNDEYVSTVKDRRKIFEHQTGAGGTPYYLAYVRSADKKDLVDAVCRDVPEITEAPAITTNWTNNMDENTTMTNGVDGPIELDATGEVSHFEHAAQPQQRVLKPKPSQPNGAGPTSAWDQGVDTGSYNPTGRKW